MKQPLYPDLCKKADNFSLKAQKYYKISHKLFLGALTLAVLGIIIIDLFPDHQIYLKVGVILCFLCCIVLLIIIKRQKFENQWYLGRAVSESYKTLFWRFVTCSENFEDSLSQEDLENRIKMYSNKISGVFSPQLERSQEKHEIITKLMWAIRNKSLDERKKFYKEERIKNQLYWYKRKSKENRYLYQIWIFTSLFSIVCAIALIVFPISKTLDLNLEFLFAFFVVIIHFWIQINQFQELKISYEVTANELKSIIEIFPNLETQEDFSQFVLDSENAISREHTLWIAQARKSINFKEPNSNGLH